MSLNLVDLDDLDGDSQSSSIHLGNEHGTGPVGDYYYGCSWLATRLETPW
jgi:hypothetical protein